jgi:dihydropteroate synthase
MRGEPKTMQADPRYDDVVTEVRGFLADRVEAAVAAGIGRDRLSIDPGIGFGKNLQHNLDLLRSIGSFRELGLPVLAGVSRKRFIGELSGADDPADRLEGSVAAAGWCATQGVHVVRVHDVGPTVRALRVAEAIARGRP